MAISTIKFGSYTLLADADAEAIPESDVKSGAATVHAIFIDAIANTTDDVYLKIWDKVTPVVANDEPDYVIFIPKTKVSVIPLPVGAGLAFATALSYIGTKTQANAAAQSDPTENMKIFFFVAA